MSQEPLITLGSLSFSLQQAVAILVFFAGMVTLWFGVRMRQNARTAERQRALAERRAEEMEHMMSQLAKSQSEMTGRMQTMAEIFGSRQSDLLRVVNERLEGVGKSLGSSMMQSTKHTHDSLRAVHERLATLDQAQKSMGVLAGEVVNLRQVLSDKQSRGAFGQGRMEAIIEDALAPSNYAFQAVLSNNSRPDCLIHMPSGAPPLVVDAKFPLEAFEAMRSAETEDEKKQAATRFRRDIARHIDDISSKYLLNGETQETALMFVPSESVFAHIYEHFEDLVQRAYRARVVIVSPSLLMLSVQVVQSVLRDARMREQAHVIQKEVAHLMEDVARLTERTGKLQSHFSQTARDLEQIQTSSGKIQRRGQRIVDLGLGAEHHEGTGQPGPRQTALEDDELPPLFSGR
ncbi:DNA recombination protein RmuC [Pseudovibrio sp. SPO723]|uniref:DNA recombination protein RmuC n=1 Tax=Nesiotobacter zosterae TaxID=392721 RepID=UPI0029C4FDBE|nr:DNA recombination protein RmuC [Pseudovibrio sp. SPO723]MDX5592365.1 DNA recombination protein RmuC [Pseudovibrio sp. SPO723]